MGLFDKLRGKQTTTGGMAEDPVCHMQVDPKKAAGESRHGGVFVFVTPEYNHGTSAALKNAIDFLYKEWNNKAAGFVGYGTMMGSRAVESLRITMAEVQVATVRNQVGLSLFGDFENYTTFRPDPRHEKELHAMLDQLVAWTRAMQTVREGPQEGHGAEHTRPPRPGQERHGKTERAGTHANA